MRREGGSTERLYRLNILLLTPPRLIKRFLAANELTKIFGSVPPLTFLILAAALPRRHHVTVFDGNVEEPDLPRLRAWIRDADIVGLNCTSAAIALNADVTLRFVKALRPDVPVILGGHHPTEQYEGWLDRGADVVVRGEGERTFPELVECLERGGDLRQVRGIAFREAGETVVTEDRPLMDDLDDSPMPRWDLVSLDHYDLFWGRRHTPTAVVEESRGCGGRCSFCMATRMWDYRMRHKSVGRILEEIRVLKAMGVGKFQFAGDGFGDPPEFFEELFSEMIRAELCMPWTSFMRTDSVIANPRMVELAARSGCKGVFVGYESAEPEIVDSWGKSRTVPAAIEDYDRIYDILHRNGIFVVGFYISGHPEERLDTVDERMTRHARWCDIILINELRVIKGTADHEHYLETGQLAKGTFYHDPRIPFIEAGRAPADRARRIFNRWMAFKYPFGLVARKRSTRHFFANTYLTILRELGRARPDTVRDFRALCRSDKAPAELEREIVEAYTGAEYIGRLVRAAGGVL